MEELIDSSLAMTVSNLGTDSITSGGLTPGSELTVKPSSGTTPDLDIPGSTVEESIGVSTSPVTEVESDQIILQSELNPQVTSTSLPAVPSSEMVSSEKDSLTGVESDRTLVGTPDSLASVSQDRDPLTTSLVSPTSEPQSESTSEPTSSTSQPQTERTSEPTSPTVSTLSESQSESTSEPTSPTVSATSDLEPEATPEATSSTVSPSSELQTESTSEPTSSTSEPQTEQTSEPTSPTVSATSDSKPEVTPETTSQRLSATSQPQSERTSEPTQELINEAIQTVAQNPFSSGVFTVGTTGEIGIKYLFDGGKYRGQLAVFSLAGMEQWVDDPVEFRREAASRALSGSEQGHIVIDDATEGAKFSGVLGEADRNSGQYLEEKTFVMTPGDTFAFMLVPNGTVRQVYDNPLVEKALRPLFSLVTENPNSEFHVGQIADATGESQILVMEDQRMDRGSDRDYNDLVFHLTGATGQVMGIEDAIAKRHSVIAPDKDWRDTELGRKIIAEILPPVLPPTPLPWRGVFTVGDTGKITFDPLIDAGYYRGQIGLFNIAGMENLEIGSPEFITEASQRIVSGSQGHILFSDATEATRFSGEYGEIDYNSGTYPGIKTLNLQPGSQFGLMIAPHSTIEQTITNPGTKRPFFSITTNSDQSQFVNITENGNIIGFEDIPLTANSDQDYNDLIFQLGGATVDLPPLSQLMQTDWTRTPDSQTFLSYINLEPGTVTPILDTLPGVLRRSILRSENLNTYNPISLAETTQWLVGIPPGSGIASEDFASLFNATNIGPSGRIPNTYIWEFDSSLTPAEIQNRLKPVVEFAYPQVPQRLIPQATPNDALFNQQWHLNNTRQPSVPGADANVTQAWDIISAATNQTVRGQGVVIGVVDDGLQYTHPDLRDRYRADLSYDFNESENGNDPSEIYKKTISLNDVPQTLIDNRTTHINLDVAVNGYITDINVKIDIDHNQTSDLDISLIGATTNLPDPTIGRMPWIPSQIGRGDPGAGFREVLLVEEVEGVNFDRTIFDDQAAQSIDQGTAPFTGSFQPQAALANFNNQRSSGWWQLRVADDTRMQTGQLNQFALEIETVNPHGTAVAGIIAATANNTIGVSGVAPEASLASLRLLANEVTDQLIGNALSHQSNQIDIYNNSWKPRNWVDGAEILLAGPGALTLDAMIDGVEQGRNGLGNIYVFAGGNDALTPNGQVYSNVNYNGFANSRYAIAVAAIDRNGEKTTYSETGASLLVSANSGDGGIGITTTDLAGNAGYNNPLSAPGTDLANGDYTRRLSGTSAAAPIVSGVVALMLEANPNLTWRDVQHILMHTADKNHPTDSDWVQNGAGLWVNHKYGFGAVDAQEAVQLAKTWVTVPPEVSISSPIQRINQTIPDGNPSGLTSTIQINEDIKLEKIEIAFDATHPYRGDLKVVLTSPSGTQSVLAEKHFLAPDPNPNDTFNPNADYTQWTFTSTRHWGESSQGTWTLAVYDEAGNQIEGLLNSWQLELFGTDLPDPNVPPIPLNHWNARLINLTATNYDDRNNYDFSRPDAVLDLGPQNSVWPIGTLGIYRDWGPNPAPGIQDDYFAMEAWTRARFDAERLYKFKTRSDDGVGIKLKDVNTGQWINDGYWFWFDNSQTEYEVDFTVPATGEYDTYFYYYERESGAIANIDIAPTTFNARVISTIGANVRSTPDTSQPPVGVIPSGQTVTFDRWIEGEFIDYTQELGQASSLWYRIAGSQPAQWVSAAILDADPDAVPL